jgi:hypothetical protein
MRAKFRGIEVGVIFEHGVHVCGVRGPNENHVLFQRGITEADPAGIHFEYRDQGNGGYDFVRECRLTRQMLSIELSRPIHFLPEIVAIDVSLEVDDSAHRALSDGLAAIFIPCPERLLQR